ALFHDLVIHLGEEGAGLFAIPAELSELEEFVLAELAVLVGVKFLEDGFRIALLGLRIVLARAGKRERREQQAHSQHFCHTPLLALPFKPRPVIPAGGVSLEILGPCVERWYTRMVRQGSSLPGRIAVKRANLCLAAFFVLTALPAGAADDPVPFPEFRTQEIETKLGVGYAVLLVDINGDGKKDIVIVDTTRVYWYENPTWKRRIILDGVTKNDNVCVDAYDIDGDGHIDLALGADWKAF